jgi:hypothetical protein
MPAPASSRRWWSATTATRLRWPNSPRSRCRDLRFRERAGGKRAVAGGARAGVPEPACAGRGAGPAGGEDPVPRARHPGAGVRRRADARRARCALDGDRARPASSRRGAWATTARASSGSSRRRMSMPRGARWARRPSTVGLILEGFVPSSANSAWWRCVGARRVPRLATHRELACGRRAVGQPGAGAGGHSDAMVQRRDVACTQARRRAGLRRRVRAGAVLPRRRTAGQRNGAARAQLRPLDHRRRETSQFQNHLRAVLGLPLGDTPMLGWPACSTGSARCRMPRRSCARPADIGTTMARSRAPGPQGRACHAACRIRRRST